MIHLLTHRVAHLTKGKLLCLLAGVQTVVDHARLAEGFHHLSEMFFALMRFGGHAQIGQPVLVIIKGIFGLLHKGGLRTGGTACQQQE